MHLSKILGKDKSIEKRENYIFLKSYKKITASQDIDVNEFILNDVFIDILNETITVNLQPGKSQNGDFLPIGESKEVVLSNLEEKTSRINETLSISYNNEVHLSFPLKDKELTVFKKSGGEITNWEKNSDYRIKIDKDEGINREVVVRYTTQRKERKDFDNIVMERCNQSTLHRNMVRIIKSYLENIL